VAELEQVTSRYKVMVDDNFHYMDEDERYELGVFPTVEEAVAACKRIVDSDLNGFLKPGITAAELYDMYASFGEDPFVVREAYSDPVAFSAWDYAKERSDALTSTNKAKSTTEPTASNATGREKAIEPKILPGSMEMWKRLIGRPERELIDQMVKDHPDLTREQAKADLKAAGF